MAFLTLLAWAFGSAAVLALAGVVERDSEQFYSQMVHARFHMQELTVVSGRSTGLL